MFKLLPVPQTIYQENLFAVGRESLKKSDHPKKLEGGLGTLVRKKGFRFMVRWSKAKTLQYCYSPRNGKEGTRLQKIEGPGVVVVSGAKLTR